MPRPRRNARPVPRIALTGGIASGKSTVARLFEVLGAKLIDTDHVAREIVQPPSPVLQQIVDRFGASILAADGSLDRAGLRRLAFTDERARADLETIMHPAIHAAVSERSVILGGPYQLVAVPLLAETGTAGLYDRVLLVDCEADLQLRRLMLRDGMQAGDAQRMLAAQAAREARIAIAHDVIHNNGDVAALAPQVETLHRRYLRTAQALSA